MFTFPVTDWASAYVDVCEYNVITICPSEIMCLVYCWKSVNWGLVFSAGRGICEVRTQAESHPWHLITEWSRARHLCLHICIREMATQNRTHVKHGFLDSGRWEVNDTLFTFFLFSLHGCSHESKVAVSLFLPMSPAQWVPNIQWCPLYLLTDYISR